MFFVQANSKNQHLKQLFDIYSQDTAAVRTKKAQTKTRQLNFVYTFQAASTSTEYHVPYALYLRILKLSRVNFFNCYFKSLTHCKILLYTSFCASLFFRIFTPMIKIYIKSEKQNIYFYRMMMLTAHIPTYLV